MIVLSGKGLAGLEMERYAVDQVEVLLVRPDRKDEPRVDRPASTPSPRNWRFSP